MCGLEYKDGGLYRNGKRAGWIGNNGYRSLSYKNKKVLEHRLIWFLLKGEWPKGDIDHINQDRLDNRIENLRDTTDVINLHNVTKCNRDNKTSGVRDVHLHKQSGKWRSQITIANKIVDLGMFNTIEEARAAYLDAKPKE